MLVSIDSRKLLEQVTRAINQKSKLYTAEIPIEPREYRHLANETIVISYKSGILISRRSIEHLSLFKKQLFIFEPELTSKVRRMMQKDKDFRQRVQKDILSSSDVELLIRELSYGEISLRMTDHNDSSTDSSTTTKGV